MDWWSATSTAAAVRTAEIHAVVAQLVEHLVGIEVVAGSIPVGGTIRKIDNGWSARTKADRPVTWEVVSTARLANLAPISERGEIGRRTRFRIWRVTPCGFKSLRSHQICPSGGIWQTRGLQTPVLRSAGSTPAWDTNSRSWRTETWRRLKRMSFRVQFPTAAPLTTWRRNLLCIAD